MKHVLKSVLHGLGHGALVAVGVGQFVWPVLPPPFNAIVGGASIGAGAILGALHVKTMAISVPSTPLTAVKSAMSTAKK